jgi:pilus assembly protein FimV
MEIKSKQGADLQKPAITPPSGEPGTAPMPAPPASPATAETPKPEMPAVAAAPAESATASAPTAQTAPTPRKPKVVVAPPPAPGLVDQVMAEPLYLGAGAAVLALLGFVGFRLMRKRGAANEDFEAEAEKKNTDVAPLTAPDSSGTIAAAERAAASAQVTEEVDPLAEAEIYLAYGRDAQAEEILKEALAANPRRYEIHLKLLEIYAKRKDAAAFDPIARELHGATGGQGEIWQQAARLGYQLDPRNSRYAAGKPSGVETAAAAATAGAVAGGVEDKLDFNIGLDDADVGTKTDIDLSRLAVPNGGTTTDIDLSGLSGADEAPPDIDLSTISGVPERTVQVPDVDFDIQAGEAGEQSNAVDFDLDVSAPAAAPADATSTQILDKPMSQTVADVGEPGMGGLEFDLSNISLDMGDSGKMEPKLDMGSSGGGPDIDLSAINLDVGSDATQGGGPGQVKDDSWYDVQTKFDLAKAYQEMGDKEGAREILREVIAEGDDEQKAAAQQALETIA